MFKDKSIWLSYVIVFISSACTLVIELVAGRIMAPHIGVSLYTWTTIIGVVLAGISLGNYLGGRVADRWASRTTLAAVFLASGLASLGILPGTILVAGNTSSIPLVPKIVLFTALLFFVPSLLMGMTSPIVIKLSLADLRETGNVVGKIYAFSTMGSIFGTFITGFVLVSLLGTRTILWVVAITLLLMGAAVGGIRPSRKAVLTSLVVVLAYGGVLYYRESFRAPCVRETNYYCVNVVKAFFPGVGDVKAMILDHLVHSYIDPNDPTKLGYGYERIYSELTEYLAKRRPGELSTLFIGGGGYTFPRYVAAVYPGSTVDVVEIDPGVTAAAYDFMDMPREIEITSYNQDGRLFFDGSGGGASRYDIIYGDAFNDLSVPYHLTTLEFDRRVRERLADDGYYLANIIDNPDKGQFLRAYINTLRHVFPYVYLTAEGEAWYAEGASTFVVVGANEPFDVADFRRVIGQEGRRQMFSEVLSPEILEMFLARKQAILLTDDFAPVDQLIAPLFVERGY